jgi:hypothetical protein
MRQIVDAADEWSHGSNSTAPAPIGTNPSPVSPHVSTYDDL